MKYIYGFQSNFLLIITMQIDKIVQKCPYFFKYQFWVENEITVEISLFKQQNMFSSKINFH